MKIPENKNKKSEGLSQSICPINLDMDMDDFSNEEELIQMQEKAKSLGRKISENQIKTQSNVTSFCGKNRIGTLPKIEKKQIFNIKDIKGDQYYLPSNIRNIKIVGEERSSFVLSDIDSTTLFTFHCPVTSITLSKCKGLVIKVSKKLFAGIECINCSDIIIDCEAHSFVRTTTSSHCKFNGALDKNTLIDVRNSMDIYFNNVKVETNMFNEGRYINVENQLHKLSDKDDIHSVNSSKNYSSSMPSITFLKLW